MIDFFREAPLIILPALCADALAQVGFAALLIAFAVLLFYKMIKK